MISRFDEYRPEDTFLTQTNDRISSLDQLDKEYEQRRHIWRWLTSLYPPLHPFFETDEMHRQAGSILISEMIRTMPSFGAEVRLNRAKNMWYWHDDGEPQAAAQGRDGYEKIVVNDYINPFCFPQVIESGTFYTDRATRNDQEPIDIDVFDSDILTKTAEMYASFRQSLPEINFFPDTLPADITPQEAANFQAFHRMIWEAGLFYDYLDLNVSSEDAAVFKQAYYYIERNKDNAATFYEECGPFERFEKIIYETYGFFGHLNELATGSDTILDQETNYRIQITQFWYIVPSSLEGLTAKWVDKYVGLMVGLQGPFDWQGSGYSEPPEHMVEHITASFNSMAHYYNAIREKLGQRAQYELDYKMSALINTYIAAGFETVSPVIMPGVRMRRIK